MSGEILVGFVEFGRFSFDFDRFYCVSVRLFLARNWCGGRASALAISSTSGHYAGNLRGAFR
jgi:hypothetical protein